MDRRSCQVSPSFVVLVIIPLLCACCVPPASPSSPTAVPATSPASSPGVPPASPSSPTAMPATPPGSSPAPAVVDPIPGAGPLKAINLGQVHGRQFATIGYSLTSVGEQLLMGAPFAKTSSINNAGRVLVSERGADGAWQEVARLEASDARERLMFGQSLAATETTLLVGASSIRTSSTQRFERGAYVFVRDSDGRWQEQARLEPAGGPPQLYGVSVAIDGDTAVVGAPLAGEGRVFVFERSGTRWREAARLRSDDSSSSQRFGQSLALAGDRLLVGAPEHHSSSPCKVFEFERRAGQWSRRSVLVPDDPSCDGFGQSLASSGERVMVGAPFAKTGGSVFVFALDEDDWRQEAKLTRSGVQERDVFGGAIALAGDIAVIGASDAGQSKQVARGAALVFERTETGWSEALTLSPSEAPRSGPYVHAMFGESVHLAGDRVYVGATGQTLAWWGMVYAFRLQRGAADSP